MRAAFKRARAVAPAILFLDELDALVGKLPLFCLTEISLAPSLMVHLISFWCFF